MKSQFNRYNFSCLPDKFLGFYGSHISECYVGKNFDSVNIDDIIEYDGIPNWSRWQEIEIEKRVHELDCDYITWTENNKVIMRFITKNNKYD